MNEMIQRLMQHAYPFIAHATDLGGDVFKLTIAGVKRNGVELGDWEVEVRQVKAPAPAKPETKPKRVPRAIRINKVGKA